MDHAGHLPDRSDSEDWEVSIQIGGKYYADTPCYGPNWGVRFNFTLLYATGRPPAPVERTGLVK